MVHFSVVHCSSPINTQVIYIPRFYPVTSRLGEHHPAGLNGGRLREGEWYRIEGRGRMDRHAYIYARDRETPYVLPTSDCTDQDRLGEDRGNRVQWREGEGDT